jgi:hypothetical protein
VNRPPITAPTTAAFLRSLIPDPLWQRLGNRPALSGTVFGDSAALVASVGCGAPCRLLVISADWNGDLRCYLWSLGQKGVKDVASEVVRSTELVRMLERWLRDFLS